MQELPDGLLGKGKGFTGPPPGVQRRGDLGRLSDRHRAGSAPVEQLLFELLELRLAAERPLRLLEQPRRDVLPAPGCVRPAAAHRDLVGPQLRAFVDRQPRALGRPLALAELDLLARDPRGDDPLPDFLLCDVELPGHVRELTELDVKHLEVAKWCVS